MTLRVALALLLGLPLAAQEPPPGKAPEKIPEKAPEKAADEQAEGPPVFVPMPVPRTLIKYRGEERIVVDGSLQDWPSAPPLLLDDPRQISGTAAGAWRGTSDLAAQVFLLWDEDDLFVAAVVRDDWHRALDETTPRMIEIPPADSVLLWLDPKRDTRSFGPDPGRREDAAFWLADVPEQGRKVVLWDRLRGTVRYAEGAAAAIRREPDRWLTTYEARIPWSDILPPDEEPRRGLVVDLQVIVSDYDEITDLMPQTRIGWTFGMGPRIDPALLGAAMLAGPLEEPVVDLPPFPDPPDPEGEPVPPRRYWIELLERLRASGPVRVERASEAPPIVLGPDRLALLEELEQHVAAFPRIDYLELQQRVHRHMPRESAGIAELGLPFFWRRALEQIAESAAEPLPERGFRILALPSGGWLVRSRSGTFAIDAAGFELERRLARELDFAVLTAPIDITRRNDQLLLRLAQTERPFYTHVMLHLPGIAADEIPLVQIGKTYTTAELEVRPLGVEDEGRVSPTAGYLFEWPDGTTLVHAAESTDAEQIAQALDGRAPDLLILPATHPRAAELGRAVGAELTVLDGLLLCASRPGGAARTTLADGFTLQTALRPAVSVILAPGDALDVAAGH